MNLRSPKRLTDDELERIRRICISDDADTDDLIELTGLALMMYSEIRAARAQLAAQAPVVEAAERFVAASDDDYDDSLYENLSREVIALRKSRAGGS